MTEALKGKIEAWAATCFPPKGEPNYSDLLRDEYISDMTKGAELALESAWIDVKERMPHHSQEVNVYPVWVDGKHGVSTRHVFNDGRGGTYFEHDNAMITHWQPLPSPPNKSN